MTEKANAPRDGQKPLSRVSTGRSDSEPQKPRIVVGVDGSQSSLGALRLGAKLAQVLNMSLDAVDAWRLPTAYPPVPTLWSPESDAKQVVEECADTVFGSEWPAWFRAYVKQGAASTVLVEESQSADMLIVGSRGHGGFRGLLLGSVSAQCVEHAGCPVLVTRDAGSAHDDTAN